MAAHGDKVSIKNVITNVQAPKLMIAYEKKNNENEYAGTTQSDYYFVHRKVSGHLKE